MARPTYWSLPCVRLLIYKLYILRCSSLVHILNKILPSSPLCLSLKPHSPTRARDARPHPRPSHFCRSVVTCAITITPLTTNTTCFALTPITHEQYLPLLMCSPITFVPLFASTSDQENRSLQNEGVVCAGELK